MEPGTGSKVKLVPVAGDEEQEEEVVADRALVVAGQYELVRTIFAYLPWRDLETASKVCKLWREVFAISIKERWRYNSVSFYWEGKKADMSYYSKYPLFQSPHHAQLYHAMESHLSELAIKPRLAVVFGTGDTEISVSESLPNMESEDHMERSWLVDKDGVVARLPPGCSSIATTSRGIVATNLSNPVELENLEAENSSLTPALSMLLIPQPPGARILPFHLAENQLEPLIADIKLASPMLEDEKVLQAALLQRAVPDLRDGDKVKAVVLLSNGLDLPFSMHIIQAVSAREGGQVAVGGAVGDLCWSSERDSSMQALMRELFYFNYQSVPVAENSYMSTSGFVIAGDNVQAASILLSRKVRGEKKVLAELEKLKECGIPEENSFAFMFACCGRGRGLHKGKAGLESACFRKLFPRTPLAGFFGNGEIGVTHLPSSSAPAPEGPAPGPLSPGQFLHSFTTVFLLVSTRSCS